MAETSLDSGCLLGTRPNVYPPVAEEVAQWHFDPRMLFAIPENSDDQPTPFVGMYRHPHVLNRTGPSNLRQSRHARARECPCSAAPSIPGLVPARELRPVPSVAIPPLPLLLSKFSALLDRVCAAERRDKFPSDIPGPLNVVVIDSLNTGSLD
jgi:hypothetical protein